LKFYLLSYDIIIFYHFEDFGGKFSGS